MASAQILGKIATTMMGDVASAGRAWVRAAYKRSYFLTSSERGRPER